MYFTSLLTSAALLSAAHASTVSNVGGSNQNGVATYNGYTCTGAIYVGCSNNLDDAFCCVGAYAQQNICNYPQPTTCSQGSYVPLTAAGTVKASATGSSAPASMPAQASGSSIPGSSFPGSASAAANTGSSTSSHNAAATAMLSPQQIGAGALAVVVKVLFL